jgi:dihydroxyacetone kinase
VAVILNGLGSVKYEELFLTYRAVAALLDDAGLTPVQPEVGELVTSFEMAGVSLTLCWLDEELEAAWTSPVAAPAFRRGVVTPDTGTEVVDRSAPMEVDFPDATEASRSTAAVVLTALRAIERTIHEHAEHLGRLDAVAGDGDHGIGMQRGITAAVQAAEEAVEAAAGTGATLVAAGDAWAHRAGGTSGALWGAALRTVGDELGDERRPNGGSLAVAISRGADTIAGMGRVAVGDKTMLDAIVPFAEELTRAVAAGDSGSLLEAWTGAAQVATQSAEATADLLPRAGRARTHLGRSRGTPDPGAVSFALAVTAVARALSDGANAGGL